MPSVRPRVRPAIPLHRANHRKSEPIAFPKRLRQVSRLKHTSRLLRRRHLRRTGRPLPNNQVPHQLWNYTPGRRRTVRVRQGRQASGYSRKSPQDRQHMFHRRCLNRPHCPSRLRRLLVASSRSGQESSWCRARPQAQWRPLLRPSPARSRVPLFQRRLWAPLRRPRLWGRHRRQVQRQALCHRPVPVRRHRWPLPQHRRWFAPPAAVPQ